jgi:hypothetical protein
MMKAFRIRKGSARVLAHGIEVTELVDVVEERKGTREEEHASRADQDDHPEEPPLVFEESCQRSPPGSDTGGLVGSVAGHGGVLVFYSA